MKKIILTCSIIGALYTSAKAQRNHEKYTNDEILKLSNHILSLETSLAQFETLQGKYVELYNKYNAMKAEQKIYLDSINKLSQLNSNILQRDAVVSNVLKTEVTEDDVLIEKQMLEFLKKIQFDIGSYKIKEELQFKLDIIVDFLKKYKNTKYDIIGYADTTGKLSYNLNLSRKRAMSVKNYLVSKGVASERLNAIGLGEETPVQIENITQTMQESRRAEIRKTKEESAVTILSN